MTFHTDAIYEGGVLRPLVPLSLNEREVVSLSISTSSSDGNETTSVSGKQRSILAAFVSKMESLPNDAPPDGFSNRDHDKLIYGK